MTLKRGSKLKILSKKKVPLGAQCSMEAIRSKGSNYMVRHVKSKGANNHAMVEQVSQKVGIPCRTRLDDAEAWAPGDVVEVFDNNSWKMATVSEVLGKMHILVRLLGSSQEFKVRKTDIRVRQPWNDDGARVMVGKGNKNCNGGKLPATQLLNHSQNSTSQVEKINSRTTLWKKDDCFAIRNKNFEDSYNVRILKRSTNCSSGAFYGASHNKVRLIEKEGRYVKGVPANPTELQIDPASYLRDSLGERHGPASLNQRLGGNLKLDVMRKEPISSVRELNDVDSIMCSVGSCSISNESDNSSEMPCDVSAGVTEQIYSHFRDDRSPHDSGHEGHCLCTKEELAAKIHRLELHAYRCTIEALHASGPLSWEQEVLITNLRLSLNISNDEHLKQLKCLISANTSISVI